MIGSVLGKDALDTADAHTDSDSGGDDLGRAGKHGAA